MKLPFIVTIWIGIKRSILILNRRLFSLIEVIIAILLVSVIGGVTVFSLIPFYQTYRFRIEVDAIYDLVQELQLEALTLKSDMKIFFAKRNGKWVAQSHSDESILKSQSVELAHVDQINAGIRQIDSLTITFYSNGFIQPREVVSFSHRGEKRGIDFTHPSLIKLCEKEPVKFETPPIPKRDELKAELEKEKK